MWSVPGAELSNDLKKGSILPRNALFGIFIFMFTGNPGIYINFSVLPGIPGFIAY